MSPCCSSHLNTSRSACLFCGAAVPANQHSVQAIEPPAPVARRQRSAAARLAGSPAFKDLRVFVALRNQPDREGTFSYRDVASRAGISRCAATASLKRLESLGIVRQVGELRIRANRRRPIYAQGRVARFATPCQDVASCA